MAIKDIQKRIEILKKQKEELEETTKLTEQEKKLTSEIKQLQKDNRRSAQTIRKIKGKLINENSKANAKKVGKWLGEKLKNYGDLSEWDKPTKKKVKKK